MDDKQFELLLAAFALSRQGYRKVRKGAKKRVGRHMADLGCRDMAAYLDVLKKDETARLECRLRLTVPISRFFRDRHTWRALSELVLPELLRAGPAMVRVWSAGCAAGEEVYSFKIAWDRLSRTAGRLPELELIATDLHPHNLARAREGVYPASALREMQSDERDACFDRRSGKKSFAIKVALKTGIDWRSHDLLSPPPISGCHVIFLRNNLLTYYTDASMRPALTRVLAALAPKGYLIVGAHERLPVEFTGLVRFANAPLIYRR